MGNFAGKGYKNWKRWLAAICILAGGECFYLLCHKNDIGYLFGILARDMGIVVTLFEESFGSAIAKYWFGIFYMSVIYLPLRVILYVLGEDLEQLIGGYQTELLSVLAIVFMLITTAEIKRKKQWVEWIRRIPMLYIALGAFCGFCADGVSELTWRMGENWEPGMRILVRSLQIGVDIFLYGLGISFGFISLGRQRYKRESELKDEYLRMSKTHYEGLVSHMREVRSIRHDIKAHMNVLERYIQEEKWKAAKAYLQEMKESQSFWNMQFINVGNELVNAVLMEGMQQVRGEIEFVSEGVLPEEMNISDFDLCTIFSNLLSNSVEACLKLKEKEKKILLQMKTFENHLAIVMENPIEGEVPVEELGSFTSKNEREKHGYGIGNMKQTVEKYGGEIEFHVEKGVFQVKILFTM